MSTTRSAAALKETARHHARTQQTCKTKTARVKQARSGPELLATTTTLRLGNTQVPPRQWRDCRLQIVTIEKRFKPLQENGRASEACSRVWSLFAPSLNQDGRLLRNKQATYPRHDNDTLHNNNNPITLKHKKNQPSFVEFRSETLFDLELTSFKKDLLNFTRFCFGFCSQFQLTPRLTIGDVHEDIQKLRVIDKVKASVERVYERRKHWKKKLEKVEYFIAIGLLLLWWFIVENKKPNRESYDF